MKLTTIKKTAPLALLAVVLSGTAFAKGPKPPQASIDVHSTCEVKYYDMDGNWKPTFVVTTTITDASGDTPVESNGPRRSTPLLMPGTRGATEKLKSREPEAIISSLVARERSMKVMTMS